jgi:hypothetical protein
VVDPSTRLSAAGCLAHPWVTAGAVPHDPLTAARNKMQVGGGAVRLAPRLRRHACVSGPSALARERARMLGPRPHYMSQALSMKAPGFAAVLAATEATDA